ncbi:MAG: hypothetical protein E6929_11570 [Clostridium sp.]|nr:hypothetical protein [Clostridium sp.]
MLGDKYKLDLKIGDNTKYLYFSYYTLKNLYKLLNKNPFTFLREFLKEDNKEEYLATLIYCMASGKITLEDIDLVLEDEEVKNYLLINIIAIITVELKAENVENIENEEDNNDNENDNEDNDNNQGNKEFEDYWNYSYYVSTVILNKSENEFLKMSPRELSTLAKYNIDYYKNILLDAYITVLKAKNEDVDKNKISINKNIRFKDLFM